MRITNILLAIGATIALAGCHSSKKAASVAETPAPSRSVSAPAAEAPAVERLLSEARSAWTDVQMPLNVKLRQPANVNLNATAYMRRGEYIKFSVRMLGFEVASAWIDTDSVHAIDKVGKRYVSESVSRVTTDLGLDISDIQDILLGRVFNAGDRPVEALGFSCEPTEYENLYLMRPEPRPATVDYGFVVSGGEAPLLNYLLIESGKFNAVARYSDHDVTEAGTLARSVELSSTSPKKISAELTWNLGSAKWNRGDRQKWQAPGRGYTKISLSSLLSILNKL
ncbi:MAG: DUF4292 domain-containing protein [[Clostridium] fimetarium]|nr:DUF4292 domain-containing protein [Alistipes timonensis]MCM1405747.1 DUF4292 domain-containing protein [[Clostridium] fimetarium]